MRVFHPSHCLFQPLWKMEKHSKSYVFIVAMTMTCKVLKYFSFCDKISSCLFARDHSFNTYAKFSDKLTFPTLRYAQARTYQINDSQALVERFQTIKIVRIFFGNLDSRISRFYRKRIISRKILVCGWGLPFWKLKEYTNNHRQTAPTTQTFNYDFL